MKTIITVLLMIFSLSALSEEVAHFATEEECITVKRKVDQTYATIRDYDGTSLYMNGNKVVNIDCAARITNLNFNRWGYVNGVQFKSEPKMIIETQAEFNARFDRLVDSRNNRDKFINDRSTAIMKRHGL